MFMVLGLWFLGSGFYGLWFSYGLACMVLRFRVVDLVFFYFGSDYLV